MKLVMVRACRLLESLVVATSASSRKVPASNSKKPECESAAPPVATCKASLTTMWNRVAAAS
jgi:hypothetical protein